MKPTPYSARQIKLQKNLSKSGFDGLMLNPGPSLRYLTGLDFHLMERPIVLFFMAGSHPVIILPEFESLKINDLDFPLKPFYYGENPATWNDASREAAKHLNLSGKKIGLEPGQLRLLEYQFIKTASPATDFIPASQLVSALRVQKDSTETNSMRKAVQIAEQALLATLPIIRVGMTEKQIAAELTMMLLRQGSDNPLPFSPIVASGPNSANPHATPTDRELLQGNTLLIDWGAAVNGYFSDLTRTFSVGEPTYPEIQTIAEIVHQANLNAQKSVRPEVKAQSIDAAARDIIAAQGYGKQFTHRVGHGLGMEPHEEPYLHATNEQPLITGMVFTIEPGIYLPGIGGVRIEDNLVVIPGGSECMSTLPRTLVQI